MQARAAKAYNWERLQLLISMGLINVLKLTTEWDLSFLNLSNSKQVPLAANRVFVTNVADVGF